MEKPKTTQEFEDLIKSIEATQGYRRPLAFGVGIAHQSSGGELLDTLFMHPNMKANFGTAAILRYITKSRSGTATVGVNASLLEEALEYFQVFNDDGRRHDNIDAIKNTLDILELDDRDLTPVISFIDTPGHDPGCQNVGDAYLRLHLLSHRLAKPNELNLDGLFEALPNNVWTNEGPIAPEDLMGRRIQSVMNGRQLKVYGVDKFPPMLDYVVPSGVRIADGSRVRLGAHLSTGTVVMHEGFVNFNAGTLGKSMVEGRISAGVVVGDQTDIGGGASIMGTLSGGGKERVSVGRGCLIGANSGTGISLGDLCVIEAGLYVTAGMPVLYQGRVIKAIELSGQSGLTFRRNSQTGQMEVFDEPNKVQLNETLHNND